MVQSLVRNRSFSQWLKVRLFQHVPASALELSHRVYIHTQETIKNRKEKIKQVHFVEAGVRKCLAKRHLTVTLQLTPMLASSRNYAALCYKGKRTNIPEWILR